LTLSAPNLVRLCLTPEQGFDVPAAAQHAKNQHVFVLDTAYGKAPQAVAQVLVTGAPYVGMAGKQKEAVSDGIDQTVGNLDAAALWR
jgi:hypothetical protein